MKGNGIHKSAIIATLAVAIVGLIGTPGAAAQGGLTPQTNLSYANGPVIENPHVNLILWGSNWNQPGTTAEVRESLLRLFNGLSGSGWQGILSQYFDTGPGPGKGGSISKTVIFDQSKDVYLDSSVTAPKNITQWMVEEEIRSAALASGWPGSESGSSPERFYVVAAAPGSTYDLGYSGFCGFHTVATSRHVFTFLPSLQDEPFKTKCHGSEAPKWASIYASHEYAESLTDPYHRGLPFGQPGWAAVALDKEGKVAGHSEIGDLCMMQSPGQLENGAWVQRIRDNYNTVCSLSNPSPPVFDVEFTGVTLGAPGHATLEGVIEPAGHPTSYAFSWSSEGDGRKEQFPRVDIGSGPGPVKVSFPVSGLKQDVKYQVDLDTKVSTDLQGGGVISADASRFQGLIWFTPNWRPGVSTEAATMIDPGAATLNGTIDTKGLNTDYQFEYGLTTAYGSKAPAAVKTISAGSSPVTVSEAIGDLTPGTTYHYRLVATNSQGTTYGPDRTFEIHPPRFEAGSYPATIGGAQDASAPLTFKFENNLQASCKKATFAGQLSAASQSLSVTPSFGECTLATQSATIAVNGCAFLLKVGSGWGASYSGGTEITCPAGKAIEMKTGTCRVDVGAQAERAAVNYSSRRELQPDRTRMRFAVSGLKYVKVTDSIGCPFTGTGAKEDGGYSGDVMADAIAAGAPTDLSVEGVSFDVHEPRLEAEEYPASISGSQSAVAPLTLTIESNLKASCKTATFSGQLKAASQSVSLTPTYGECTLAGQPATAAVNGCAFVLGVDAAVDANSYEGSADLSCPAGQAIVITTGTCQISLTSQADVPGLKFSRASGIHPSAVSTSLQLAGLKYTKVKDSIGCALNGTGSKEDGSYAGGLTLIGANAASQPVGVRVFGLD